MKFDVINKVSNIDDDQDEQKIFEFEFFTGRSNPKFDSLFENLDFQAKVWSFQTFCNGIIVKKYQKTMT